MRLNYLYTLGRVGTAHHDVVAAILVGGAHPANCKAKWSDPPNLLVARLNDFIKNNIDMPDKLVDLLIRFLSQNDGKLSKRARDKEFSKLTEAEVQTIERKYEDIFNNFPVVPGG